MLMNAPAPVPANAMKPIVIATAKKKTGLLPMKPDSSHMITIARGTPEEKNVYVIARDPASVVGARTRLICMHPKCAGKSWGTLAEMYNDHPAPAAMARAEEIHVFGQWSDDVIDAGKITKLERVAAEAEARAKAAEAKAAKVVEDVSDEAERTRERAIVMRGKADEAHNALLAAKAPLGLIAPPDLRKEDE